MNNEAIDDILNERGSVYGSFFDNAYVTQNLVNVMRNHSDNYDNLSDVQKEAIHMICHKLARATNGVDDHVDNWKDIAGYAQLVVDDLTC